MKDGTSDVGGQQRGRDGEQRRRNAERRKDEEEEKKERKNKELSTEEVHTGRKINTLS